MFCRVSLYFSYGLLLFAVFDASVLKAENIEREVVHEVSYHEHWSVRTERSAEGISYAIYAAQRTGRPDQWKELVFIERIYDTVIAMDWRYASNNTPSSLIVRTVDDLGRVTIRHYNIDAAVYEPERSRSRLVLVEEGGKLFVEPFKALLDGRDVAGLKMQWKKRPKNLDFGPGIHHHLVYEPDVAFAHIEKNTGRQSQIVSARVMDGLLLVELRAPNDRIFLKSRITKVFSLRALWAYKSQYGLDHLFYKNLSLIETYRTSLVSAQGHMPMSEGAILSNGNMAVVNYRGKQGEYLHDVIDIYAARTLHQAQVGQVKSLEIQENNFRLVLHDGSKRSFDLKGVGVKKTTGALLRGGRCESQILSM